MGSGVEGSVSRLVVRWYVLADVFCLTSPCLIWMQSCVSTVCRRSCITITLSKKGKTPLMIACDTRSGGSCDFGDCICVLNQGEIMQVDTPMNLYQYPATSLSRATSSPAMNVLKVRLDEIDGVMNRFWKWYSLTLPPQDKQAIARENWASGCGSRSPWAHSIINRDAVIEVNTAPQLWCIYRRGNELYLYSNCADKLVARVPSDAGSYGKQWRRDSASLQHHSVTRLI